MSRFTRAGPLAVVLCLSAWSPALRGQDALKQAYDAAQHLFQSGEDERAAEAFRALLSAAWRDRAALDRRQGLWDRVKSDLESAQELAPQPPETRFDLAHAHFRLANWAPAAALLEDLVRLDPANAPYRGLLGRTYFSQGKLADARRELRETVRLAPGDSLAAYTLAVVALSAKDLSSAASTFEDLRRRGDTPQFHLLAGRAYLDTGYQAEAQAELRKTLRLDPKVRHARYLLALSLLRESESAAIRPAMDELHQELALYPDEFAARYLLGLLLEFERRWDQAAGAFRLAAQSSPDEPDAHFHLGNVYLKLNRPREAADALRRALGLSGQAGQSRFQSHRAHYLLSRACRALQDAECGAREAELARQSSAAAVRQGRLDLEEPAIGSVLEAAPSSQTVSWEESGVPAPLAAEQKDLLSVYDDVLAAGYDRLGLIAARQKQFVESARWFARASSIRPDLPDVDFNLGLALAQSGDYRKAVEPLQRAAARGPARPQLHKLLGLSYFQTEQYGRALESLGLARAADPADEPVLLALGTSLLRLGRAVEAQRVFVDLIRAHPDSASLHLLWGQAYAQQGRPFEAEKEFRRALGIDPGMASAHSGLGLLYLRRELMEEAGKEFQAELDAHPGDTRSRYHLAFTLAARQQFDEAVSLLRQVVAEQPDFADAHYELGKALLKQGQTPAAIEHLERAVSLAPRKAHVHYQLGRAYQKAGREDDARREFQVSASLKRKPAEE